IPIVCCQECNHTSDGSLNKQIIIGGLDIGQPHENVAIRTTNWLTSRPSSGAFLFPPSLPTRQCRGTSRTTRWCCAAMYGLGLRKSALSTIGFVSSIDSVETPRPRNRSSVRSSTIEDSGCYKRRGLEADLDAPSRNSVASEFPTGVPPTLGA